MGVVWDLFVGSCPPQLGEVLNPWLRVLCWFTVVIIKTHASCGGGFTLLSRLVDGMTQDLSLFDPFQLLPYYTPTLPTRTFN